jgi:hypothetical protein
MLYRSTDCRCRRGAPVVNLSHSASFHSGEKIAPSKPGIKHLVGSGKGTMQCYFRQQGIFALARLMFELRELKI